MLMAWTRRLDQAHDQMQSIRRRCIEHGEESELIFVCLTASLVESWRANFTDAAVIAEDTMERAAQTGRRPAARRRADRSGARWPPLRRPRARGPSRRRRGDSRPVGACGSNLFAVWPITIIGFLEVSLGNYQAALTVLEPLLATLAYGTERDGDRRRVIRPRMRSRRWLRLDRLAEAEPLVDMFERNGGRLDRAWMLAVGARCRAMVLAARGDVDAASDAAAAAMVEHDRLPMPFERARTQLLVGQLQRRRRRKRPRPRRRCAMRCNAFDGSAPRCGPSVPVPSWPARTSPTAGRPR